MSGDDFKAKKLKEDENKVKGSILNNLNVFKNFSAEPNTHIVAESKDNIFKNQIYIKFSNENEWRKCCYKLSDFAL